MTASAIAAAAAAAAGVDAITPWPLDRSVQRQSLTFYVGCHMPRWMEESPVPLFISARTLAKYRSTGDAFPKGRALWSLDSGGFTELQKYGEWTMDADTYGGMVYRFMEETGYGPRFAAPQDWMCEPAVINGGTWNGNTFAGTGLSVAIHQDLTIENFLYLREHYPAAPWIPVLQGWSLDDYLAHADAYAAAGVDLAAEQLVGLGSVCRRQSTDEIALIASTFHRRGLRLHGFGVKTAGLRQYGQYLASADSLAWSFAARMEDSRLASCTHRGPCNNCLTYAVAWRERVLASLDGPKQGTLALDFAAA